MSDTSRGRRWWRRFRSLNPWVQGASWAALALIILGSAFGGESGSGTTPTAVTTPTETPAQTQTPTPTATTPQSPTSPSPTPTISLAQWRDQHATNIVLVIGTANNLIKAIDAANETGISVACSALKYNYGRYLQPIPPPPGGMEGTWYDGKDGMYSAQHRCSGGLVRRADLYQARLAASAGVTNLFKVVGQ